MFREVRLFIERDEVEETKLSNKSSQYSKLT